MTGKLGISDISDYERMNKRERNLQDIGLDTSRKEHRFLRDNRENAMQVNRIKISDINPINHYVPNINIIKSF